MEDKYFEEFNLDNEIDKKVQYLVQNNYEGVKGDNYSKNKLSLPFWGKVLKNYYFNNTTRFTIVYLSFFRCELIKFNNSSSDGNILNYYFEDTLFGKDLNRGFIGEIGSIIGNNDETIKLFEVLYINEGIDNGNFSIVNFKIKNILIHNRVLRYSNDNLITKLGIYFSKIEVKNNQLLDNLLIDNIEIGELVLENINNNFESFELRNCKIDKLIIKNSNLGKAVFNGVTIGKLEIQNATLNDCIFNGVDFEDYELEEIVYKPTIIKKLKECKKKTNIKVIKFVDYKCMKDNYRQLKHIMDKNGNYIEANHFHSLEMEYTMKYYYSLESSKDSKLSNLYNNEFLNFDIIESSNKYILNLSYLINNFGINPIRNFFVILSYIYCVMAISFFSNYAAREIETVNYQAVVQLFVGGTMIISAIYIFVCYIRNPVANVSKFQKLFTTILFILFFVSLFMDYLHFKGVYTLIYLINPFSGLTPNSMSHLLWTEQIGMIIHKIIYGILIYQLIISLKRTTKR